MHAPVSLYPVYLLCYVTGDKNAQVAFMIKQVCLLTSILYQHHMSLQDKSKNNSYCWICHEGGDVLCCNKCPWVFHLTCSKLQHKPESEEWTCPTCRVSLTFCATWS